MAEELLCYEEPNKNRLSFRTIQEKKSETRPCKTPTLLKIIIEGFVYDYPWAKEKVGLC
jgi:hypothetical protein